MKLKTWRENNGLTRESVARLIGVANASVIMRWERGQVPRPEHMAKITLVTAGAVQPNDFYDLPGSDAVAAASAAIDAPAGELVTLARKACATRDLTEDAA